jgi:hypothetical protein
MNATPETSSLTHGFESGLPHPCFEKPKPQTLIHVLDPIPNPGLRAAWRRRRRWRRWRACWCARATRREAPPSTGARSTCGRSSVRLRRTPTVRPWRSRSAAASRMWAGGAQQPSRNAICRVETRLSKRHPAAESLLVPAPRPVLCRFRVSMVLKP